MRRQKTETDSIACPRHVCTYMVHKYTYESLHANVVHAFNNYEKLSIYHSHY